MRALGLLLAALIGGVAVWQIRPLLQQREAPAVVAEPRTIAPAGDLAADEKATIELFERSKGSVVFITTTQRVLDLRSRNVMQIPRGAGSGFVSALDRSLPADSSGRRRAQGGRYGPPHRAARGQADRAQRDVEGRLNPAAGRRSVLY